MIFAPFGIFDIQKGAKSWQFEFLSVGVDPNCFMLRGKSYGVICLMSIVAER
jgi:hypothetical protein